jgi:hypothetical protein
MIWSQGDDTQSLNKATDHPVSDIEGVNKTFMEWGFATIRVAC